MGGDRLLKFTPHSRGRRSRWTRSMSLRRGLNKVGSKKGRLVVRSGLGWPHRPLVQKSVLCAASPSQLERRRGSLGHLFLLRRGQGCVLSVSAILVATSRERHWETYLTSIISHHLLSVPVGFGIIETVPGLSVDRSRVQLGPRGTEPGVLVGFQLRLSSALSFVSSSRWCSWWNDRSGRGWTAAWQNQGLGQR